MRFILDLEHHCIETQIRKLYNVRVALCLREPMRMDELEPEIEGLRQALESLDFASLRTDFPELSGGSKPTVCLEMNPEGRFVITINGTVKTVTQK
ncbi:MAG: hypothetical protein V1793_13420 [Pseudomonadota bacterium]